eukprot:scaffold407_cov251-Pinguiococcus_pyrenoidosus.AAC.6
MGGKMQYRASDFHETCVRVWETPFAITPFNRVCGVFRIRQGTSLAATSRKYELIGTRGVIWNGCGKSLALVAPPGTWSQYPSQTRAR